MNEDKLQEQLKQYQDLAKQDPKVDVSGLMINAFESAQTNSLSPGQKRLGYFVSFAFPPFGLLFALKFYFSGKDDGKQAAVICAVLTVFVMVLFYVFIKVMLSSTGVDIDHLQQIDPKQIQELIQ